METLGRGRGRAARVAGRGRVGRRLRPAQAGKGRFLRATGIGVCVGGAQRFQRSNRSFPDGRRKPGVARWALRAPPRRREPSGARWGGGRRARGALGSFCGWGKGVSPLLRNSGFPVSYNFLSLKAVKPREGATSIRGPWGWRCCPLAGGRGRGGPGEDGPRRAFPPYCTPRWALGASTVFQTVFL